MTTDFLIRAHDLNYRFANTLAVSGVDLAVARGEIVGLLGPNGAGKSTTMKMLCGVLEPDSGAVWIDGIDLAAQPRAAKRRIGYLPEIPPLYRTATVDEYLAFCARIHGVDKARVPGAVEKVRLDCGLEDCAARLIGNLSKGYQQRVGIAQAIIHEPDVVILDEPTVGLDPNQVRAVRTLIKSLGRDRAVILSTHLLPEVQQLCGRALILHRGRLAHDVSLSESAAQRFQACFKTAPGIDALHAVPGVRCAERLAGDRFSITMDGDDPAAIAEAAAMHGWGLVELVRVATDLERLFVDLSCADEATSQ